MAQVSIHSLCNVNVCKLWLIKNELLYKYMMKVQENLASSLNYWSISLNIRDKIRNGKQIFSDYFGHSQIKTFHESFPNLNPVSLGIWQIYSVKCFF